MDEPDFNPRTWGEKGGQPAPTPAPDVTANAKAQGEAELPEMWQGIGTKLDPTLKMTTAPPRSPKWTMILATIAAVSVGGAGSAFVVFNQTADKKPVAPQALQPAEQDKSQVERSLRIAGLDMINQSLVTLGVSPDAADKVSAVVQDRSAPSGPVLMTVLLQSDQKGYRILNLRLGFADGSSRVASANPQGQWTVQYQAAELVQNINFVQGEIDTESFYASAVAAGVPDTLVPEFINAFGFDFNLELEVSPGDTFEVAFERSENAEGQAIGRPELLYAKLTTATKSLALYRFADAAGKAGWFDGNGATNRRGFMRTPVDGARITSRFGMRFHPTRKYNRLHGGVDFGASTGTPIYAAADGVVDYTGAKGCNGNLTILSHADGYKTFYLHQSRWSEGIAPGAKVQQGQHIGDVGMTPGGNCVTGPHLHYEVHVNGERIDPLSIPTEGGKRDRLNGADLASFLSQRNTVDRARLPQAQ